jgi:hypothetical protein
VQALVDLKRYLKSCKYDEKKERKNERERENQNILGIIFKMCKLYKKSA